MPPGQVRQSGLRAGAVGMLDRMTLAVVRHDRSKRARVEPFV
jgi:hypothetical protein